MTKKAMILLVVFVTLFLAGCSSLRAPKNGNNYACYTRTTMDLYISEGNSTVTYTCGEEGNNFTKVFNIPDDKSLFDTIRSHFTKTNLTTGVILDDGDNLIQLYRIRNNGLEQGWPQMP